MAGFSCLNSFKTHAIVMGVICAVTDILMSVTFLCLAFTMATDDKILREYLIAACVIFVFKASLHIAMLYGINKSIRKLLLCWLVLNGVYALLAFTGTLIAFWQNNGYDAPGVYLSLIIHGFLVYAIIVVQRYHRELRKEKAVENHAKTLAREEVT